MLPSTIEKYSDQLDVILPRLARGWSLERAAERAGMTLDQARRLVRRSRELVTGPPTGLSGSWSCGCVGALVGGHCCEATLAGQVVN